MAGWIAWLIVACLFGIGELLTGSLFLAPFAIGGLAGAAVDLAGSGVGSWVAFIVVSLLTLMTVRPMVARRIHRGPVLRTGAAAVVGRQGVVLERIVNTDSVGTVKIDGEVWTARSYDDERTIEAGTPVQVVEIRGATAMVME